jgi:SSS family solute:Na+ symporter
MKIYTARNVQTLKKTIVFYPTFQLFLIPILFIGFAGVNAFPNVAPPDAILPTIVTSMELPSIIVGLFCAGALAASMSSGDAILHAAASVLVKDLYGVIRKTQPEGNSETDLIRWLTVAIGALAYYLAVLSDYSLVYLLLLSYGFIAQLFPTLIALFFWRRSTPAGVIAGLLTGCAVALIWNLVPSLQWQEIHPGIWGVAAHVVALVTVSLLTSPMDPAHVRKFVEA